MNYTIKCKKESDQSTLISHKRIRPLRIMKERKNMKPSENKNKQHTVPLPAIHESPGSQGMAAIFICPVCGNSFVRTMPSQSKCTACLEKEKAAADAGVKITYESFDGGGPRYSAVIEDPSIVSCSTDTKYKYKDGSNAEGSGYYVYLHLKGLKEGTTTLTVTADSFAVNFMESFTVTVDSTLAVQIEAEKSSDDVVIHGKW